MTQELEDKEMQGNTQPLNSQDDRRIRQSEDQQMDGEENAGRGAGRRVAETTDPEAER